MNRIAPKGKGKEGLEFDRLILAHAGVIAKVARAYSWNAEDRADLSQEIQIQLWRAFPSYDYERKFSTWMYRIALNTAISYVRRNSSSRVQTVGLNLVDEERLSAPQSASDDRIEALELFIRKLDDLNRALLLLYLDDLSHREIAETLGISETNVATKIGRIKERFRNQFKDPEPKSPKETQ
jgi:RNA polymerase sigma-70 factor (ECF subfamily)